MPPTAASASCSRIATQLPRPTVTSVSSPIPQRRSATRTTTSRPLTRPPVDPLARIQQGEALARGAEQGFDLAQHQNAAGRERVGEGGNSRSWVGRSK